MAKQNEIRDRVAKMEVGKVLDTDGKVIGSLVAIGNEGADQIFQFLHSQGVVRKTRCPDCEWALFGEKSVGMTPCYSCNSTGYIIKPLVGGRDDNGNK